MNGDAVLLRADNGSTGHRLGKMGNPIRVGRMGNGSRIINVCKYVFFVDQSCGEWRYSRHSGT